MYAEKSTKGVCTKLRLCKWEINKVAWAEPHNTIAEYQQQGGVCARAQGRRVGDVVVCVSALAMCVHEFGGGATEEERLHL